MPPACVHGHAGVPMSMTTYLNPPTFPVFHEDRDNFTPGPPDNSHTLKRTSVKLFGAIHEGMIRLYLSWSGRIACHRSTQQAKQRSQEGSPSLVTAMQCLPHGDYQGEEQEENPQPLPSC